MVPEPGAVAGAMFWPIALLIASEILTRKRWPDGWRWVAVRALGLLPVAAVAAVISYLHLHGLLDPLPGNPDRGHDRAAVGGRADGHRHRRPDRQGRPHASPGRVRPGSPALDTAIGPDPTAGAPAAPAATAVGAVVDRPARHTRPPTVGSRDTGARIARLRATHPDISTGEIARRLRISDRTVRRYLNTPPPVDQVCDVAATARPALITRTMTVPTRPIRPAPPATRVRRGPHDPAGQSPTDTRGV